MGPVGPQATAPLLDSTGPSGREKRMSRSVLDEHLPMRGEKTQIALSGWPLSEPDRLPVLAIWAATSSRDRAAAGSWRSGQSTVLCPLSHTSIFSEISRASSTSMPR